MTIAPDTGENEQLGPSEHQRRCPENALTDITDLFTAAKKNRKRLFMCFVLRTYLQFWISFSSISGPKILLLTFQFEKVPLSNFASFAFLNVIYEYKAKVSSRTWAPNFSGAPGPI